MRSYPPMPDNLQKSRRPGTPASRKGRSPHQLHKASHQPHQSGGPACLTTVNTRSFLARPHATSFARVCVLI